MFKFKQFSVDQSGCAMKINTDGVLLGALADVIDPQTILDIGTGTGVIALMLAQRFASAKIDAVEIDEQTAQTAGKNFQNSSFANRLTIYPSSFQDFFKDHFTNKYDLIVSNPPFHLNSLTSPDIKKSVAKHTGKDFFEELMQGIMTHLTGQGQCWLILPLQAAAQIKNIADNHKLYLQKVITIYSSSDSEPHREILGFGKKNIQLVRDRFVIYKEQNVYSEIYKSGLKDFFTIF